MNINEKSRIRTAARFLVEGDILVGSGFTVTRSAWRGCATPKGKVNVEGFYPDGANGTHYWNGSTTMMVLR